MEFKANEIKAGLMIIASATIFIIFVIAIFGIDFEDNTKEYKTDLQYIGGISVGSLVKYGGMDVGFVSEISLPKENQTKITLKIKIDQKTPVRRDSKAYLTSIGIMTNPHIEISTGARDSALLPAGSHLESKEVLSFTQMAEPFSVLSTNAQELMNRIDEVFNKENQGHLTSILKNVDSLIVDGKIQFLSVIKNLEELTGQFAALSRDMNELMDKNKGNLNDTVTNLEKMANETSQLISDFRTTLAVLENMMTANSTNIIEIMENFQYASQNLEEFSRIVKERPWLLVRKSAPPERKIP